MHNESRLLVHDYQALVFIDDVYRYLLRLYVELAWRICQLYGNLVERLDFVVGLHRLAVHQHGLRLGGFLYAVARCVRHAVHKVLVDADWVYPFIYCEVVMLVFVGALTFRRVQKVVSLIIEFFVCHHKKPIDD